MASRSWNIFLDEHKYRQVAPKAFKLIKKLTNCTDESLKEILDDLIIYKKSEDKYLLVINASNTDEDLNWFKKMNDGINLENITSSTGMIAIQGPEAINKITFGISKHV